MIAVYVVFHFVWRDDVVKMVSLSGAEIDLPRIKLNTDEQMCWYIYSKFCRIVGFNGC